MTSAQRIAILVDSENIEIAAAQPDRADRTRGRLQTFPDWKIILRAIVGERSLIRLIYFKEKGRPLSRKFITFWQDECQGEIQRPVKSADSAIIMAAVTLAPKVDALVIVSGDKDFLPLVPYLKAQGCRVEIASFSQAASAELRRAADLFYRLGAKHTLRLQRSAGR